MRAALAILTAALSLAAPARAATFTITSLPDGRAAIRMDGKIERGDASAFATISDTLHPAAVLLSSPGGDLGASLSIGKNARRQGLLTIVAPHASCASGCGLIWLAGVKRYVASDATVGFHAPSPHDEASMPKRDAASASVGAYMARLGLSDAAIDYMTTQPSSGMAWLDWDKAHELNVKISPFADITGYHPAVHVQGAVAD